MRLALASSRKRIQFSAGVDLQETRDLALGAKSSCDVYTSAPENSRGRAKISGLPDAVWNIFQLSKKGIESGNLQPASADAIRERLRLSQGLHLHLLSTIPELWPSSKLIRHQPLKEPLLGSKITGDIFLGVERPTTTSRARFRRPL